ncbi:type II toxin-antitoxin system YafQ family toxin [Gardnerella sp. DNF01199S]|uniref:type II toxin-antitoxin system YafQ family toxin n=1 Tax=Gardnerella sp. DNF01199S TaxID=2749067 RepID=UPI003BAC0C36
MSVYNKKYRIAQSRMFKKDLKLAIKRGYNISLLEEVVDILASGVSLPGKYKDHKLTGNYDGCRECHITPDWLLVYEIADDELILYLTRTGTHSDLFGK